jgi:hypothetical protein
LRKVDNRVKRGTVANDKMFWDYDTYGKESWIEVTEYERRMQNGRERTRRFRARQKHNKGLNQDE